MQADKRRASGAALLLDNGFRHQIVISTRFGRKALN